MRGMLASGLYCPSKWAGQAVMSNWMHRQGLDGRPQKKLAFLTSESGSPKKWFAIAHEHRWNEGYARFEARLTMKMGRTGRDGKPDAYTRSWRTSTNLFCIFNVGIQITQKMVCNSTRKSSKWGVCSLRGTFDLQNGSDRPWGPTGCIDKVLTNVHKKISIFDVWVQITQKWFPIAHKNRQNEGYAQGSFYLQNGLYGLWGQTVCIDKV